jgi:hypothetical protein
MTARTFQFHRFPADQARRLVAGPRWGRRALLGLAGGLVFLLVGASFLTFEPRGAALSVLLAGVGMLVFSGIALSLRLWRALRGAGGRPWGRLLVLGMVVVWAANTVAIENQQLAWFPTLNGLQWVLAIALLARLTWLARRTPSAEAGRWAAGATGENMVAAELEQLEDDHVVIHNLPLPGRGDADHVVVGPAGVVVIETKYLAGRIAYQGDDVWIQLKRDEVRHIGDPSAQVRRAADAIEVRLSRYGLREVPVLSLLVMAHPRADLDVARSPRPGRSAFRARASASTVGS